MATPEHWAAVVGYEDVYQVSSRGQVRRVSTGRVLKPFPDQHGYPVSSTGRLSAQIFTAYDDAQAGAA